MISPNRAMIAAGLALTILAGGLRIFRLGASPFAGDETATLAEADSLLSGSEEPSGSQTDRLPRLIPLAYAVHLADYRLFGRDEFNSRVLMAAFGTASVALIYFGMSGLPRFVASVTASLVALWPQHLFQSQQNRFYITAWFFSAACMVLGGRAIQRRSVPWTLLACLAAFAAVLSHTLQILLFFGLFSAFVAVSRCERKPLSWRLLLVIVIWGIAVIAFIVLFLFSYGGRWNEGQTWGYSSFRSILASVIQVGWPTFLLAGLGAWWAYRMRNPQGWYWMAWAFTWGGASVVLPRILVFHPDYVFPLALPVIVLAACAMAQVADALRPTSASMAVVWSFVAVSLQMPSIVSHYSDGSRMDYRTAARQIAEWWRPGDRLAADSPGLLFKYAKLEGAVIRLRAGDSLRILQEAAASPGRLWIVVSYGRSGLQKDIERWLGQNCTRRLIVRKPRLDYYEFVVEVYLHAPVERTINSGDGSTTVPPIASEDHLQPPSKGDAGIRGRKHLAKPTGGAQTGSARLTVPRRPSWPSG
jgi:hypothetical protein